MTLSDLSPASAGDGTIGFNPDLLPSDGSLGRERTYEKGSLLWSQNKPCGSVFVLKRGEVEVCVQGSNRHETTVRIVKPGELCGFVSFCKDRSDRSHTTARATVRTTVVEIPVDEFVQFLSGHPQALLATLLTACERLSFAEERAHVLSYRRAEDRLMALLLQLTRRSGHPSPGDSELIRIQYTHSELARYSGMNRPHVSVVLGRLRASGVIKYSRGSPILVHLPRLQERLQEAMTTISNAGEQSPGAPPPLD